MEHVADFSNVEVRRNGRAILDAVDWTIDEGQHWVILGANGAGKTTLVNLLTGRVFPSFTTGVTRHADVLGYRLGHVDVAELRSTVGTATAADDHLISPRDTVLDVVLSSVYGKISRGREVYEDEDLSRARDLLHIFGIAHIENRAFSTLSGGEKQRTRIARALVADPQILVLDEPTTGLDMGARELLMMALEEILADRHAPAMVLVTHHVEEIPRGFTHVALMRDGSIIEAGPIGDVLVDEAVSATFGLPLTVESHDGRWWARAANSPHGKE